MKNSVIDVTRFTHLLRRQLMLGSRGFLLGTLAFGGPTLAFILIRLYFGNFTLLDMKDFLHFLMFLAGFILTGKVFNELNNPQKSYAYLTLPASTFEKLGVAWIFTSPAFIILYSCFLLILLVLGNLVGHQSINASELFDSSYLHKVFIYMAVQPVFLAGACHFKKNSFLKTVLTIFIFQLSLALIGVSTAYFLFHEQSYGSNNNFNLNFSERFGEGGGGICLFLLGAFFMTVTYFKLKEREI